MKKIFLSFLSLILIAGMSANPVKADNEHTDDPKVCGSSENVTLVDSYMNENGEQTDVFSNNAMTIYHEDGRITVYVPTEKQEGTNAVNSRVSWVYIGKILWSIVNSILTSCTLLELVNGENPCFVAADFIKNPPISNGEITYDVDGIYHQGYIPGCEPSHSWGCNQGYWEYEFTVDNIYEM